MKDRDILVLGAVLLFLFFYRPKPATEVSLKQTCVYPDGTTIQVNLGDECPFDSDHGGASVLQVI